MRTVLLLLARLQLVLTSPPARLGGGSRRRGDRGDVPGWVLVTVMTAGLVMVIWQVAGDQLTSMLSSALSSVK